MFKKLLAGFLTATMVIGSSVLAFADDTTTTINTAGTQNATVTYEKASSFSITIPKSIKLTDKTADYTVSITGDIYGNEIITVSPDSTFNMTNKEGKKAVTASISQAKTSWESTELSSTAATTTGTITADGMTAGTWEGTFNFNINKA